MCGVIVISILAVAIFIKVTIGMFVPTEDDKHIPIGSIRLHCLTHEEGKSIYGEYGGKWIIQIKEKYSWCSADQCGEHIGWRNIDEKLFRYGKAYDSKEEAQEALEKRINYKQPDDVYI